MDVRRSPLLPVKRERPHLYGSKSIIDNPEKSFLGFALRETDLVRPYRIMWRNRVDYVRKVVRDWKEKVGPAYHVYFQLSIESKEAR